MNQREKKEVLQIATDVRNELCPNGNSRDMCHAVSKEIVNRLVALKYDAILINCHVDIGYHYGRKLSIAHYYVQVNTKYLDATLDQFARDRGHSIPPIVFGRKPNYVKPNSIYATSLIRR